MATQLRIIIRVHVNTSGTTRSLQGQDNLDGGAHSWPIESLDPDLSHARTNCLWFKGASVRRTGCSTGTCCPGLPAVPRGPPSWPLVSTLEFRSENGKRLCVTFTDGHAAIPIIIGVHANTSGTTRSVQGQDDLDGGEHCWQIECHDPDLSHARTICLWFRSEDSTGVKNQGSERAMVITVWPQTY